MIRRWRDRLAASERTTVCAELLRVRTWGHPLTAAESAKLDSELLRLALEVHPDRVRRAQQSSRPFPLVGASS